jgi:hypothetical protein
MENTVSLPLFIDMLSFAEVTTLGDGMDYRLQIMGGNAFVLFQYSGCGLKEKGEKSGNLSIGYYGDLQNMKCLLAGLHHLLILMTDNCAGCFSVNEVWHTYRLLMPFSVV